MVQTGNLGDLIDRSLDLDRPAVIDLRKPDAPRWWTHRAIDLLAGGVAQYLTSLGLKRGARVAILSFNRAEYIAAYFGIMRAGFVAVPVNVKLARDTIDFVMHDAKIEFAFVDNAGRTMIDTSIPMLDFDDNQPGGFAATIPPAEFEAVEVGTGEIGQMLYTSGSSGRPKGVPLSHAGQRWAVSMRTPGLSAEGRYIIAQPLFHMNGLFSMKVLFAANGSVVLLPGFDARQYIAALSTYRVTNVVAVPTMFARVVKETSLLQSLDFVLRKISLASAPVTLALIERVQAAFPGADISLGYGTTEAGPAVFGPHPDGIPTPPLSIGYPVKASDAKLIDGPDDANGVLVMRNPAVMAGYLNLPERTSKVLEDRWYYSGDVMRRDNNGFYYFVGRADDMFVCSGENIYPVEVEKLLENHPLVQQAAVVPLADDERGQMPVAFVVVKSDAELNVEELKRFAIANGPAYQHPRRVEFVTDLPWAGTNKVDRLALIARARSLESNQGWSR